MTLLENWRNKAYGEGTNDKQKEELWKRYFLVEKGIYEQILEEPDKVISCTVSELADRYGTDIETMDENTAVKIEIDPEKLYYNMVEAKADWLYSLPQWDKILNEGRRKELYKEQKKSGTVVKGRKIGRNETCPCGSGKKYKHCCGKN